LNQEQKRLMSIDLPLTTLKRFESTGFRTWTIGNRKIFIIMITLIAKT